MDDKTRTTVIWYTTQVADRARRNIQDSINAINYDGDRIKRMAENASTIEAEQYLHGYTDAMKAAAAHVDHASYNINYYPETLKPQENEE